MTPRIWQEAAVLIMSNLVPINDFCRPLILYRSASSTPPPLFADCEPITSGTQHYTPGPMYGMSSSRPIVLIDRLPERLISGAYQGRSGRLKYITAPQVLKTTRIDYLSLRTTNTRLALYSWKLNNPQSTQYPEAFSTLEGDDLDRSRAERATKCLQSCEDAIQKLEADWGSARNSPPALRKEVLQEIRGNIVELQGHSSFALQVLHSVLVQQSEEYRKIVAWLSAPDPWTNHNSARRGHEDSTVNWLLQSHEYQKWKSSTGDHVWIHGSPGCGKTVLCSTVVEDIRDYCQQSPNTAYAIFYFTFSDIYKQASEYLIRSLVAQLGWREPGYSMLRKAYETSHRGVPMSSDELKGILLACIQSFKTVFLLLDALDECPEEHDCQEDVLKQIGILTSSAPNLKTFATSRGHPKIRHSMDELGFKSLEIVERKVDTDIQTYVSMQLSHDDRFSKLDPATLDMIETTISEQADGIFRYAYCQIQELKKLKSSRPNDIRLALKALPRAVDEMHTRLLQDIEERYQQEAFTLLEWLAYARSPLTLGELAEAVFIHADEESCVDAGNRGDIEDVLNLLSGLVVFEDSLKEAATRLPRLSSINIDEPITGPAKPQCGVDVNVQGGYYGNALQAASSAGHLEAIQLLLVGGADVNAEGGHFGSALQAASSAGHIEAMQLLLVGGADVNARSGEHRNAIQAASYGGYTKAIQLLLDCGADVNAHGGKYGNALYTASERGHKEALHLLLEKGANVNSQGGKYGNPLQAASVRGDMEVVQSLLHRGADPRATGGIYSTALHAASSQAFPDIVRLLLRYGADVEARSESLETPLQVACVTGATEMATLLLDFGANPNAAPGSHGTCLRAAALSGADEIVRRLLSHGVELSEDIPQNDVLFVASRAGNEGILCMLLKNGVSPNTSALKKASEEGHEQVVDLLVLAGAVASTQNQEQTKSSLPRTSRYTEQQIPDTSDDDSDMQTHGESVFSGKKLSVATLPTTLSSHLHQEVIQRQTISATEESAEPEDAPVRLESLRHESADSSHMPSARSFNNRDLGNTDPTKDAHEDVKHEVTAEEPTGAVKKSHTKRQDLDRLISDFRRNGLQVRIVAAYGATAMHGDNARPQDINLPSGLTKTSFLRAQSPVYLELCVNRSSRITRLGEIMLVPGLGDPLIKTDQQLFAKIRSKYNEHKRKGLFAFLYRPCDIHYVKFGYQVAARQLDIYQTPAAIPPRKEVVEKRYHYFESPLKTLPPMPKQTFYQYFYRHEPGCTSLSSLFCERLPKKLGASITAPSGADELAFGWGLHIIEGPNKPVLAILVAIILSVSFVIAVLYDIFTRNKDSGFAIGQWVVGVLSALLAAVYFHFQEI
ncbi:hypothetical protein KC361_g973 [Hortaea werneckii]|nr:hypothetical protein KC361_g973 [Hortaea werneckii]